jgi:long-subunit acyl-CoA synthetase (AMP-forming)
MLGLGIPVVELWEMSESPCGTINPPGAIRIGTVTPTMKVKRHAITAKYADLIDSLYAASAGAAAST